MSEVDFTLIEGNDPLRTFTLQDTLSNGSVAATDLTNAVVEFFIKESARSTDADAATIKYSTATSEITIQSPATAGKVDIQFAAADLATAGKRRYRLDVIRSSKRLTYAYGTLTITNV